MAWMVLLQSKTTRKQPLPDPNGELSSKIPSSGISCASACVGKRLNSLPRSSDMHSRGPYTNLSPAQKFEIWDTAVMRSFAILLMATAKEYHEYYLPLLKFHH